MVYTWKATDILRPIIKESTLNMMILNTVAWVNKAGKAVHCSIGDLVYTTLADAPSAVVARIGVTPQGV